VISEVLSGALIDAVIEELSLAVVLLDRGRVIYQNTAARGLSDRLGRNHATQLVVLLRDHIDSVQAHLVASAKVVSLITAGNGEPFYIHVRRLDRQDADSLVLVCVRELAPERDAVKRYYGLSDREAQVVELVLRGYGNRDIASTLGISPATAKKHLTSIFNKVGVDTRSQLISRLA
jgi:NarL family two-component system response regulator YdfI